MYYILLRLCVEQEIPCCIFYDITMGELLCMYSFKAYFKEMLLSEVFVDGENVTVTHYSDLIPFRPFGVITEPTYKDLLDYYEERSFPEDRVNCKAVLKSIGLDYYDPELICRKTHGQQFDDFVWLQFSDEPQVCWQDIKMRD